MTTLTAAVQVNVGSDRAAWCRTRALLRSFCGSAQSDGDLDDVVFAEREAAHRGFILFDRLFARARRRALLAETLDLVGDAMGQLRRRFDADAREAFALAAQRVFDERRAGVLAEDPSGSTADQLGGDGLVHAAVDEHGLRVNARLVGEDLG